MIPVSKKSRYIIMGGMNLITKKMVQDGIEKELIRFIADPDEMTGTVCEIGEEWFHFGAATEDNLSPDDYLATTESGDIVESVFQTLNDMREGDDFSDEYAYYESFLRLGLRKRLSRANEKSELKHCPHCGYLGGVKSVYSAVSGETKYKAVCLNEYCIASKNEFLYDTPKKAVEGWNYRVSPSTAGFSIYE